MLTSHFINLVFLHSGHFIRKLTMYFHSLGLFIGNTYHKLPLTGRTMKFNFIAPQSHTVAHLMLHSLSVQLHPINYKQWQCQLRNQVKSIRSCVCLAVSCDSNVILNSRKQYYSFLFYLVHFSLFSKDVWSQWPDISNIPFCHAHL